VTFTFQCPFCNTHHRASDSLVGRSVRCPGCDQLVDIPTTDAAEEGDADAARTAILVPGAEALADETVLLEAAEVTEHVDLTDVVEVTEAVEPRQPPKRRPPARREDAEEESHRIPSKRELSETELDMTPMVDVVFNLLIFFMVTAAFALQKSLEIPKPADEAPSENRQEKPIDDNPDFVTVQIDEFNTYHVLTVDWEEEAPSVQDLHIRLRRAREGDSTGTVPTKLLVEAHGDALHGRVVASLDAGTATGFEEVQLTTMEEGD
jgi:biopolymer transport protein ExbD